jgi:hypothetical protein
MNEQYAMDNYQGTINNGETEDRRLETDKIQMINYK